MNPKMPSWKSPRWREKCLENAKIILCDWDHRREISAEDQGKRAHEEIGIPARTWVRISLDFVRIINRLDVYYYLFLAGVAVGWVAARKKYER